MTSGSFLYYTVHMKYFSPCKSSRQTVYYHESGPKEVERGWLRMSLRVAMYSPAHMRSFINSSVLHLFLLFVI